MFVQVCKFVLAVLFLFYCCSLKEHFAMPYNTGRQVYRVSVEMQSTKVVKFSATGNVQCEGGSV